jgi:methylated-DNA-[protein]-cysteine S-methyltransferase
MATAKRVIKAGDTIFIFPSKLGWMGIVVVGDVVKRLTFGHKSAAEVRRALVDQSPGQAKSGKPDTSLVRRLQEYAAGRADSFHDVAVDFGPVSDFRRRVYEQCREIPLGRTMSYAELAAKAGAPGAARAVGNCMAANGIPLLVPCHRVVCTDGSLGSYSAAGGVATKRKILALELRGIGLEL